MEQRSDQWFSARLGKVTASRISDVFTGGKGITRRRYMDQLFNERTSGQVANGFETQAMRWGTDNEPIARRAYELHKDVVVAETGFIDHPRIEGAGASPDGLVGENGLIEIKCPNTKTHLKTIESDAIQKKYMMQMQWQMACTGRTWCDFVSYDPRAPENRRFFVKRINADAKEIARLEKGVRKFLKELFGEMSDSRSTTAPTKSPAQTAKKPGPLPVSSEHAESSPKKIASRKKRAAPPKANATVSEQALEASAAETTGPFRMYDWAREGKINTYVTFSERVSKIKTVDFGINLRTLCVVCPKGTSDRSIGQQLAIAANSSWQHKSRHRNHIVSKVRAAERKIFRIGENVSIIFLIACFTFTLFGGLSYFIETYDPFSKIALYVVPWLVLMSGAVGKAIDWIRSGLARKSLIETQLGGLIMQLSPRGISKLRQLWMTGQSAPVHFIEELADSAFFEPLTKEEKIWFLNVLEKARKLRSAKG